MFEAVISYCSWLENDQMTNINDFVNNNLHRRVPVSEVERFFRENRIDYYTLPQYLKDKIDELDVY